jgi:hypothetical protein
MEVPGDEDVVAHAGKKTPRWVHAVVDGAIVEWRTTEVEAVARRSTSPLNIR